MKKSITLALITALLLMVLPFGLAEGSEIEIQSGITLGMTEAEIKAALSSVEEDTPYNGSQASKILKANLPGHLIGTATAEYAIDNDGNMFAATLSLGNTLLMLPSEYGDAEQDLVDQYGNPDNTWLPIAYQHGYEPLGAILRYFDLGNNPVAELDKYSSWLVPADDTHSAIISHYYMEINASIGGTFTYNIVGYQLYDNEELGL